MHIRAQAHVIGKIPTAMVGIGVDDNLIGVPEPAVAEGNVGRGDIPVPAIEPEAGRSTAGKMPHMTAAKATGELAMRKGLVEVVAGIGRAGIVTYPGFAIYMRDIGVAGLVTVIAIRFSRMRRGLDWPGPMRGNRRMRFTVLLAKCRNGEDEQSSES